MSDLPRSEPSTEPRGLPLPYGLPGRQQADQFARLRSQLVLTAVLAGCVIVLLAAAGFGVIAAGWYPEATVAMGLAGGTVAVGVAAALRLFFLFRALQQVPPPAPVPRPAPPAPEFTPEPWSPPRQLEQRAPVEFGTPVFNPGHPAAARGVRQAGAAAAVPHQPRHQADRRAGAGQRGPGAPRRSLRDRPPVHAGPPPGREPGGPGRRVAAAPVDEAGQRVRGAARRGVGGRALPADRDRARRGRGDPRPRRRRDHPPAGRAAGERDPLHLAGRPKVEVRAQKVPRGWRSRCRTAASA